jgi:ubiquinone/menaquinone biosynthesis C-methylase UbiE
MVDEATRRATGAGVAERVRVQRADVAALPLEEASVDMVVSSVSFHHWTDVPAAVRELRRVTRPTGRVWIYDARIAPWRRLTAAADVPVPRTSAGLLFTRAELPHATSTR